MQLEIVEIRESRWMDGWMVVRLEEEHWIGILEKIFKLINKSSTKRLKTMFKGTKIVKHICADQSISSKEWRLESTQRRN